MQADKSDYLDQHQSVNLDRCDLGNINDELDTAPDLDHLVLLAHWSVGDRSDNSHGAGLVDDDEVGETAAASIVGTMDEVVPHEEGVVFEHLEAGRACEQGHLGEGIDSDLAHHLHPDTADHHDHVGVYPRDAVKQSLKVGKQVDDIVDSTSRAHEV